jgi:hypothetical protein
MLKIVSRLFGQELIPDMILTVGDNSYVTRSAASLWRGLGDQSFLSDAREFHSKAAPKERELIGRPGRQEVYINDNDR